MASVPTPIAKFISRYIDSSEGEEQVKSKAPVQSVNGKSGDIEVDSESDALKFNKDYTGGYISE